PTDPAEPSETPELDPEELNNPSPTPEIDAEALTTERNDGVYTFLVVGRDKASNSTDTIIIGKFDTKAHTIDLVNVPRDTLVNIGWNGTPKKLNAIYPGYINSGKSGIEGLLQQTKNLLGFDVDFYAVVNIDMVIEVIDALGGVDFDVPINMDYDDPIQNFHVHLKKGYQHLNGNQAMGVFRFRQGNYAGTGYPRGDLQRIETQQALLMALAGQMLDLGNIPNLKNIIDICMSNVETTLSASNMAFFARQFLKCSRDSINFRSVGIGSSTAINGISFVSLPINGWLDIVNQYLNPYKDPITRKNVNMIATSNGYTIETTLGYLAGGYESFFCVMCTSKHGTTKYHAAGVCPPDVSEDPEASESPEVSPEASESPAPTTTPDAATPTPDAATPTPDAATPTPDATTPTPPPAIDPTPTPPPAPDPTPVPPPAVTEVPGGEG
ncbi:MAG: LCP family protein, partial [Oscillospiraceae bacterium]|nr:LCP family protein [Oscillospiraceae bacterium]